MGDHDSSNFFKCNPDETKVVLLNSTVFDDLNQKMSVIRNELKNLRQDLRKQKSFVETEVAKLKNLPLKESNQLPLVLEKKSCNIFKMVPIGLMKTCFLAKNGIPRQASLCKGSTATLTIDKAVFNNPEHSLDGLSQFSHVWIIFMFHKNGNQSSKAKVHPPRLNGTSVGVFGTRSPHRPCPVGLSLTKLDKIEGNTLFFSGVDILDGTPVLDIKPYIPQYDSPSSDNLEDDNSDHLPTKEHEVVQVSDFFKHPTPCLTVAYTQRAMCDLQKFHPKDHHKTRCPFCVDGIDPGQMKTAIEEILKNDPRSSYRRNKCSDRLYYFSVYNVHVTCWFDDNVAEVLKIVPLGDM